MYQLEFVKYNNILFKVNRKFHESKLKPDFDTNVMKQWTRSDTLLRKNGILYCCETIQEAVIVP